MMIFDDLELILFSIRGALVATLIASLFALLSSNSALINISSSEKFEFR